MKSDRNALQSAEMNFLRSLVPGAAFLAWALVFSFPASRVAAANLLAGSDWYTGASGTTGSWSDGTHTEATSAAASGQVVTGGTMTATNSAANGQVGAWTYFNAATLLGGDAGSGTGDSATMSFTLTSNVAPTAAGDLLRMGLFNSQATAGTAKDTVLFSSAVGTTGSSSYSGDSAWAYLGTTANTLDAAYQHSTSSGTTTLLSSTGNTALTLSTAKAGMTGTTAYSFSLTYTLTSAGLVVAESVNGTQVLTATDTAYANGSSNYTFDTLDFFWSNAAAGDSLTFGNPSVQMNAVPEPSTAALLWGTGIGALWYGRRRMAERSAA